MSKQLEEAFMRCLPNEYTVLRSAFPIHSGNFFGWVEFFAVYRNTSLVLSISSQNARLYILTEEHIQQAMYTVCYLVAL